MCISQVDVFGLADPYVCVSAIAVPGSEKVLHGAKITAAQVSKSGQWLIKPQGMTKTVKNELNPIFEEQFVLDSTVANPKHSGGGDTWAGGLLVSVSS